MEAKHTQNSFTTTQHLHVRRCARPQAMSHSNIKNTLQAQDENTSQATGWRREERGRGRREEGEDEEDDWCVIPVQLHEPRCTRLRVTMLGMAAPYKASGRHTH